MDISWQNCRRWHHRSGTQCLFVRSLSSATELAKGQIQPASIDLRLGKRAGVQASFPLQQPDR